VKGAARGTVAGQCGPGSGGFQRRRAVRAATALRRRNPPE
jgi:hypothetical protein